MKEEQTHMIPILSCSYLQIQRTYTDTIRDHYTYVHKKRVVFIGDVLLELAVATAAGTAAPERPAGTQSLLN